MNDQAQVEQERLFKKGKETNEAILRLSYNRDFKLYQEYLQEYLYQNRKKGDFLSGDPRGWNQGWSQCLQFIIDLPDAVRKHVTAPQPK